MKPARRIAALIAASLMTVHSAEAERKEFPEFNFSIDIPAEWKAMDPLPPQAAAAWQNSDRSKGLMVSALKSPSGDAAKAVPDMRAGLKKGLGDNGWKLEPDQVSTLGSVPSSLVRGSRTNPDLSIVAYIAAAGEHGYMCSFSLGPGGSFDDAEVKSIASSFRLLKAAAPQPLTASEHSAAYKIGYVVGRYFFVIVGFVLLLVVGFFVLRKRRP